MKKGIILVISIFALIITFVFAEIFSIYHFGTMPTFLTSLYLISIFAVSEYLSISFGYVIRKLIKKEKLEIKKIIGLILIFVALLLVLLFLIVIDIDMLNWYAYSSPFYINVVVRSLEFLLPSAILTVISVLLMKKKK